MWEAIITMVAMVVTQIIKWSVNDEEKRKKFLEFVEKELSSSDPVRLHDSYKKQGEELDKPDEPKKWLD